MQRLAMRAALNAVFMLDGIVAQAQASNGRSWVANPMHSRWGVGKFTVNRKDGNDERVAKRYIGTSPCV